MSTNLNSKFSQTESLFRTTLAAGITSTQQTIVFNDIPGGATQFPNWFVIEPLSSNYEIIYVPDGSGTATQINVVRGINPNENTDVLSAAFCKAHPANVDVILAPMHRHWNDLVLVMQGENTTGHPNFRVGNGTDVSVSIFAEVAAADSPFLRYDINTHKWLISNDGNSTIDIAAGGSGLTRGLGVNLVASAITLDVRTSGGLRNNQGTGSQQADVDPAVVARLDTANTWTAVQSLTADNLQITTDSDSANDAVRKSYLDANTIQNIFGDGSDGDVTISAPTTLTRDMFYNNLTFSSNINCAGYSVFVKGILTRTGTAKFTNNGGNGGNGNLGVSGTNVAGGTAGAEAGYATLPKPGAPGAGGIGSGLDFAGGGTGAQNGGNGVAGGGSITNSIATAASIAGGVGGSATTASGTGNGGTSAANTTTQTVAVPRSAVTALNLLLILAGTVTPLRGAASSAGGGGGGASTKYNGIKPAGGSGGGSGASGGTIRVAARHIVDSGTGTMFETIGGNGGNGGDGVSGNTNEGMGAGGAAGSGGNGGTIIEIYKTKTGTCTTSVVGGTKGTAGTGTSGTGGSTGAPGTANDGAVGLVIEIAV